MSTGTEKANRKIPPPAKVDDAKVRRFDCAGSRPIARRSNSHVGEEPGIEDWLEEHGYEADFGPWVRHNDGWRKLAIIAATMKWRRGAGAFTQRREGEERTMVTIQSERARELANTGAPPEPCSPNQRPRSRGADEVAGKGLRQKPQPADPPIGAGLTGEQGSPVRAIAHGEKYPRLPTIHRGEPAWREQARKLIATATEPGRPTARRPARQRLHQPGLPKKVAGDGPGAGLQPAHKGR